MGKQNHPGCIIGATRATELLEVYCKPSGKGPRGIRYWMRRAKIDWCRCNLCGSMTHRDDMTLDHIVPRSAGGSGQSNYQLACGRCNRAKGSRMDERQIVSAVRRALGAK